MSGSGAAKRFGNSLIPASAGIGLKPAHFSTILEQKAAAGWFEVHPENYMMDGGPMLHYLEQVRNHYPLSFHSIGMSPGSAGGIDCAHVERIAALCEQFQPALVSDHLSWSQWQQYALNDLLPMPYTVEALELMSANIDQIQHILGRSIAIENPSTYIQPAQADMDECAFLCELTRRTGATILLDINNLYVNSSNHDFSASEYLQRIPPHQVSEIHLAGHLTEVVANKTIRIDDHGSAVADAVWDLFASSLEHIGIRPVLIEWDTRVPELSVLQQEAAKANAYLQQFAEKERYYA